MPSVLPSSVADAKLGKRLIGVKLSPNGWHKF